MHKLIADIEANGKHEEAFSLNIEGYNLFRKQPTNTSNIKFDYQRTQTANTDRHYLMQDSPR